MDIQSIQNQESGLSVRNKLNELINKSNSAITQTDLDSLSYSFGDLTSTPTTLSGYGITDAITQDDLDSLSYSFGDLTSTPTTLSGYGITDAITQDDLDDATLLTSDIIPTINVGGITIGEQQDVGTPIEAVLRELLAPYVIPSFSSLVIAPPTQIIEVGATYTPTSATINYANDSEGNPPQNVTITGDGLSGSVTLTGSPQTVTPDGSSVTRTTDTTYTWTLNGEDKDGSSISNKTDTVTWRYAWKFGGNTTVVSDNSTASSVYTALQQSDLRSNQSNTVTATTDNNSGGNYTYIAYSAEHTDLSSIIQNGSLPVLDAFTKVGEFDVTTVTGLTKTYKFYKSNSTDAFASGTTLAIS